MHSLDVPGFQLVHRDGALVLLDLENPEFLPLKIDFLSAQMAHRRKTGVSKNEPLAKALGLKSINPVTAPFVFDATAGLGVDAFIMACLGCRVRSVERSPLVFQLLQDGWQRLAGAVAQEPHSQLGAITKRLLFEQGASADVLKTMADSARPDVVYLDPMYPEEGRSKSALPKKEMQIFRRLLGDDADAQEVFAAALEVARDRVVVKRPSYAEPIADRVTHSFSGKTARFDMYLAPRR